ncbi:hypothetical protein ACI7MJ_21885, partial [Aeromonas caviae]|uniref:hypothetical protein n=1 Tax=Aeromonas caviae TaxID=648 RepID=UPI00386005F5
HYARSHRPLNRVVLHSSGSAKAFAYLSYLKASKAGFAGKGVGARLTAAPQRSFGGPTYVTTIY